MNASRSLYETLPAPGLLADLVLLLHGLIVAFVVAGLVLFIIGGMRGWFWVRNPWVRGVHLELSVLSRPEPLPVASEAELLAALQPGEDGLILEDGVHRGTFLPAVWESLPAPGDFVRQLKRKAGLPSDYWSPSLTIKRYRTESFGEDER